MIANTPRPVTLRRARADDLAAMQAFVQGLSRESRRLRFHGAVNACAPGLLRHLVQADGVRHLAFVACVSAVDGAEIIVGEARCFVAGDEGAAEFAIVVADEFHGRGVADGLIEALQQAAGAAGVVRLHGDVLDGNARMGRFMQRHGFTIEAFADAEPGVSRFGKRLESHTPPPRMHEPRWARLVHRVAAVFTAH